MFAAIATGCRENNFPSPNQIGLCLFCFQCRGRVKPVTSGRFPGQFLHHIPILIDIPSRSISWYHFVCGDWRLTACQLCSLFTFNRSVLRANRKLIVAERVNINTFINWIALVSRKMTDVEIEPLVYHLQIFKCGHLYRLLTLLHRVICMISWLSWSLVSRLWKAGTGAFTLWPAFRCSRRYWK